MPSTRADGRTEPFTGELRVFYAKAASRRRKALIRGYQEPSRWGVYVVCRRQGVPREKWAQQFQIARSRWKKRVRERWAEESENTPRYLREFLFARAYVEEYVKRAIASNGEKLRDVRRDAAIAAVPLAGYKKRTDPKKKGYELLGLPRVQTEVQRVLAEQGVTLELSGQVLAEIMQHGLDERVAAGDKLKAVELFFKVTSGFAVQKQAHLHERTKRDKFFDEQTFTAPGPPVLTIDAEESDGDL